MKNVHSTNEIKPIAMPGTHEAFWSFFAQKERPPAMVLDMGAGHGAFSQRLKDAGFSVEACDLYPEKFKAEGIVCRPADITEKLPYPSEWFDIVIAVEVSEHVNDHSRFFSEAYRVLKPGGKFYLTTPNILSLKSRFRFLLSGFFYSFSPLDPERNDGLQHVASLTADQYAYLGWRAGFRKVDFFTDRFQRSSLWLMVLMGWLIRVYSVFSQIRSHNSKILLLGRLLFMRYEKLVKNDV